MIFFFLDICIKIMLKVNWVVYSMYFYDICVFIGVYIYGVV